MTCWAYYPDPQEQGRKPEEFLRHSIDVVEYLFNDMRRITVPVIRKVSRILGINEDLAHDAVLLSGLLHDLGKTCVCYQEKPWEGFTGHWLLSAGIVFNIIRSAKYDAFGSRELLTSLFTLPILLHHYAQANLFTRYNLANTVQVKVFSDCIEPIRSLIDYGLGKARSPIGREVLHDLLIDLGDGSLNVLQPPGWVFNTITGREFNHMKIASMVIAGLLNEADGTVASRNRVVRHARY